MKLLVVDDEKNLRKVLVTELSAEGFEVNQADTGLKAIELLEKDDYDVMVLDLNLPGMNGMEVLQKVRLLELSTEVIVLTAHASVPAAIEAMKLGAYDFLTKPFEIEVLKVVVQKAGEKKNLLSENIHLKTQLRRQSETGGFITQDPRMIEILESVKKVALADFPVLIFGESGVGKELVAKAIHNCRKQNGCPFIPINCGAIAENMMESELFGHEKGAFTGAFDKKPGLLEIAHTGSLFLDEIGELTLPLQTKLLRVIETGSFFRVGGTKEVKVNVRFISATNKDLKQEVEKSRFRSDLYFRISTVVIQIPPLRERKEDIPLLLEYTLKRTPGFKSKKFTPEAVRVLSEYSWPGNVRELQNVIHRTLLLTKEDVVEPADLPGDLMGERKTHALRLEDVEKDHILEVLRKVGGQRRKAAEILDVDPKTLYRKLLEYGVKE
jgi:DNA-binding NtrC family response regulator